MAREDVMTDLDSLFFFPRRFAWHEITEADRFDDRFGAVNATEGAIMDVGDEGVELAVDGRPTLDELIAWAWLVRPDLRQQLRDIARCEMRKVIDYYDEQG